MHTIILVVTKSAHRLNYDALYVYRIVLNRGKVLKILLVKMVFAVFL